MKLNNRRNYFTPFGIFLIFTIFATTYQSNSQCPIKKEKDAFTGKITLSSDYEEFGKAEKQGSLSFKIIEKIDNDSDSSLQLFIYINRLTSRCLGEPSKILIKSGEEILQLSLATQTKICGTHLNTTLNLSSVTKQWLKDRYIDQIRIQYDKDIYDDFSTSRVDENNELYSLKNSDYFIRIFKCLEKIKRKL